MGGTWPKVKLGDVLNLSDCAVPSVELPDVNLAGVYSFGRGLFRRGPMAPGKTSYKSYNRLFTDDFVISQPKAWEGALARVTPEFDGWYLSPVFPTFRAVAERLDPRYLEWFCKMEPVWCALQQKSRGIGARRESVSPDQFLSLEIPLPPLSEQRRIVGRIEELSAEIDVARRLRAEAVEEAEGLVASVANSLFTGECMAAWPTKSLDEVAEIRSGVTLGRRLSGRTVRLPYLRVANVQDGHLDLSVIKEVEVLACEVDKWKLRGGDLLLTEGGDWDKLGRGTVWGEEIPNCIHQNHIFCVRVRQENLVPEFVARLIGSPVGKGYFQEASKQTTNLASINQRQLKAFRIPMPPVPEQRRIVSELEALGSEVAGLKREQSDTGAELDALLSSILDRAFKGELL